MALPEAQYKNFMRFLLRLHDIHVDAIVNRYHERGDMEYLMAALYDLNDERVEDWLLGHDPDILAALDAAKRGEWDEFVF